MVIPTKFLQLLAEDNIKLTYTSNRYLVEPQKTNVAPRLGFAFKATDKAVVHGGYGIFFGGLESTGYYPNFGENFPFEFDSNYPATGSCTANGSCPTNGYALETGLPQTITSPSQPTLRGGEGQVRTPLQPAVQPDRRVRDQ